MFIKVPPQYFLHKKRSKLKFEYIIVKCTCTNLVRLQNIYFNKMETDVIIKAMSWTKIAYIYMHIMSWALTAIVLFHKSLLRRGGIVTSDWRTYSLYIFKQNDNIRFNIKEDEVWHWSAVWYILMYNRPTRLKWLHSLQQ